jgi:hypothetical protein
MLHLRPHRYPDREKGRVKFTFRIVDEPGTQECAAIAKTWPAPIEWSGFKSCP